MHALQVEATQVMAAVEVAGAAAAAATRAAEMATTAAIGGGAAAAQQSCRLSFSALACIWRPRPARLPLAGAASHGLARQLCTSTVHKYNQQHLRGQIPLDNRLLYVQYSRKHLNCMVRMRAREIRILCRYANLTVRQCSIAPSSAIACYPPWRHD